MRHEFPSEWHRFLHPTPAGDEQVLSFTIGQERFPFFAQDRKIDVMKIDVLAKCEREGEYHTIISYNGNSVVSSQITMPENDSYGGLNMATINPNDAGLSLEDLDVSREMNLKVKHNSALVYTSLLANPDEVEDLFLVVHYKLD